MIDNTNTNTPQKEEPDLYRRSIKGGYWVFAIQAVTQLLGFTKSIIIANCLMLENLGLIAIAVMLIEMLNTFTQSGFQTALIQKKGDIREYLDTVWFWGILRGIVLFIIIYLTAPVLASSKVSEESVNLAILVIRTMGICVLIHSFQNIGIVYFQKELQFHKRFLLFLIGSLADIVLSITLMLIYRSVWAVIAARLITALVNVVTSYFICSYRPRLRFNLHKTKELWKYGKWVSGNTIICFLMNEGDDFFVLFYLGVIPLALYRYAYRFSNMPATHISNVVQSVLFPAYSKIQNDLPRLREAFFKAVKIVGLLTIPVSFLIFFLGGDFVHLFLPERMYSITIILQILAAKGLIKAIFSNCGTLFQAIGKPQLIMRFLLMQLIILSVIIYPLTKVWGLLGTAYATLAIGILVAPFITRLTCNELRCSPWKVVQAIALPMLASTVMSAIIILLKKLLFVNVNIGVFFLLSMIALMAYWTILMCLDILFNHGFRKIVREQFSLFNQNT